MIYPVSLSRSVKAELIKARSIRVTKVLPLMALLMGVIGLGAQIAFWLTVRSGTEDGAAPMIDNALVLAPASHTFMTALFAGILGLILVTQDLRYGVTNASFVANGSKHRIALAKLIVGMLLALLIAVLVMAVVCVIAMVAGLIIPEVSQPAAKGAFWATVGTGIWGVVAAGILGVGFGLMARRTVAGILLFILFQWGSAVLAAIIESATAMTSIAELGQWLSSIMPAFLFYGMQQPEVSLNQLWNGLGYTAWAVVIALIGYLVFQRRDLGNGQ